MTGRSTTPPERDDPESEGGVADAVRSAVERTMRATTGSAASSRERAGELVDEVVRRGREARDELAKRGQEAGAELTRRGQEAGADLARRGQEATGEVGRRLELLERRLAELEERLGPEARAEVEGEQGSEPQPNSQAED
jgi:polyhydroxyalkanoate synthesis regulator phasin